MKKRHIGNWRFSDVWLDALRYDPEPESLNDERTRRDDWNAEPQEFWMDGMEPDYVPSWEREEYACCP